ncbi:hypothetical protein EPUL_006039, partial [Erysiphe pulchra]
MPVEVPRQGERFYLRTLLTIKRGAQSFRDLYTVNGITYDVPSAACHKRNIIGKFLKTTFAAGLAHCVINVPQNIWDHFREAFIDDCLYRIRNLEGRLNPPPIEWNEEQC